MTEALTTLFEGNEIRTIEHDNEPWFPVVDLANAWGLSRNTFGKIMTRNSEVFEGYNRVLDITYARQNQPDRQNLNEKVVCVNERGMYVLLGKISIDRLKHPNVRERILRFQRWVPELIQRYRKKEIVQAKPLTIDVELKVAQHLAEQTGGNLAAFQKIALGKCGMGDYAPALDAVPAIVHGETGWFNPTRLVTLCNDPDLTPERLNYFLMNKGFQYREGYLWRLTTDGAVHGREYQYEAPSGHKEIRISWRESILYASGLKRSLSESQTALPARA